MSKKKLRKIRSVMWVIVAVLALIVASAGIYIYRELFQPNVTIRNKPDYILIPTGASFADVVNVLNDKKLLINEKSFIWTAQQMKYVNNIKPGKYLIKPKMNNRELISLLRSGKQVPVKVVFNNIRTRDQLAERISAQLEAKSHALLNLLNDEDYVHRFGLNSEDVLVLFIPNTYEFYWNTSADQFCSG